MSSLRSRVLALCLVLLAGTAAHAQTADRRTVDQWRVADGLPQDTVTSITEDARGYLWVATRKGLARFDGAQFSAIRRVGAFDLGNLRLTAVLTEPDGVVWVSTYGLGVLRIAGDTATRYSQAEGVPHDIVWDLSRDRDGRIWLASSRGARYFDGRRWQAPSLPADLASDGVNAVFQGRDKRVWLATWRHGVVCIENGRHRVYSTADGLPSANATSVAETPDGAIWIATPMGVGRIDRSGVTAFGVKEGLPAERVLQVLVDRRGVVWMATHGGGLVRHAGGSFERFGRAEGLSSDYLISLAEDHTGALWVGTLSGGLNRLAPAVRELLDTRAGLPPFPVTTVYQSGRDGTFWVGTFGGGLVGIRDGRLESYTAADGLPSNAVTTIAGGPQQAIWVGTNGGGAVLFDRGRVLDRVGPEITGATLRTIEVDHAGQQTWFGGSGLVRYAGGAYVRYGEAQGGLRSNEVRVVYSTPARTWVGTYGGGLQSLERDGRIRTWGAAEGLTNPFVTSLHHDDTDTLWIGTYGGGLFRMRGGRIAQVTTRDGLPEDVVFDVMEDGVGRLWLTGSEGLAVVRLADVHARMDGRGGLLSVTRYGRTDGVPGTDGTDGNQPLSWLARDGRLWFATVGGVVVFDPADVADEPAAPPVFVDTLQIDHRPVPRGSLPGTIAGRSVDITYSAPQLHGGRTVQYQYRLVGLHDAWVNAGAGRTASFTNLSPGDYTFEVRALARRGSTPGPVGSLPFTVPARFYEQFWFQALSGVAIVGLVVGGVRMRLGRLRVRQEELERLVDERTAALRAEMVERERAVRERRLLDERMQQAQRLESLGVLAGGVAHDFNNLLVGVLGEASLALGELPVGTAARAHVERIERAALRASELTAQMLAYSGRGRFVVVPVSLGELVGEVRDLLGTVIPREITVTVDIPPTLPLVAGDPSQLRQVVMNLLTNAADAVAPRRGQIRIAGGTRRLRAGDSTTAPEAGAMALSPGEYVWLEVRDDGVGMDAETQARIFDPFFTTKPAGRGLGLAAVQGIVRSHAGRILVASQPGVGTAITLLLPAARFGAAQPEAPTPTPPDPQPAGESHRSLPPTGTDAATAPALLPQILLVDDERLVRDVARVALRRSGHQAVEVGTGEDAVQVFEADPQRFALVILDLTLPGIQGRAVMQAIRARRADVPIVLTSGYTAEEAGDLTTAPRTVFLQKPWRPEQLLVAVRTLLASPGADAGDA